MTILISHDGIDLKGSDIAFRSPNTVTLVEKVTVHAEEQLAINLLDGTEVEFVIE